MPTQTHEDKLKVTLPPTQNPIKSMEVILKEKLFDISLVLVSFSPPL